MLKPEPAPPSKIVFRDATQVIGVYGNAMFTCASAASSLQGIEACHRGALELLSQYPRGYCQFTIASMGTSMPSPEVRTKMKELVLDLRDHILAMAYVFEGHGIWMSSMRVLTQGMMLAMPSKFPQRIFADLGSSLPWTMGNMAGHVAFDAAGLVACVDSARSQLRAAS